MVMAHAEYQSYLDRLVPNEQAREYIERARSSPPARRVQSKTKRNCLWRYASRKMGVTISGEGTFEKSYHVLLDFDPTVLEFWDQPPTVALTVEDKNGRCRRVPYTPDVLLLTTDGVLLDQVKPKSKCDALIATNPNRWTIGLDGYQDIAASRHAKAMGMTHRIVSEDKINPVMANNLLAIARAAEQARHNNYRMIVRRVLQNLGEERASRASAVMEALDIVDSTCILQMLSDRLIVANLSDGELGKPDNVWLSIDQVELERVRDLERVQVGSTTSDTFKVASGKDAKAVIERLNAIHSPGSRPARSVRRWRSLLKAANGNVLALVPNTRLRGNRCRRIPEPELTLIARIVREHYMSPVAPTVAASYRRYLNVWEKAHERGELPSGARPVTEPTYRREVNKIDLEEREAMRRGRRAGNAAAAPVSPEKRDPVARRPFERAHIDHYLADVHTLLHVEGSKKTTRRLWVSVLRDEYSGAVLGMALRIKAPSRVACSLTIRDCVRRHGRLPETLVVDNGKEFDSTYFEVLLAQYGISKQSRPPGAPRFGSTIEAFYKSLREFLRGLPGGTANDTRGRAVSSKFRGSAQASLDLSATYSAIERYCFDGFNLHALRDHLSSPQSLLEDGLKRASYSGVSVEIDGAFLALSAVPLRRKAKVDPCRGVRHLDRWYFSPALLRTGVPRRVRVLFEPWDEGRIYAVVNGNAVPCFHGRSSNGWEYSHSSMMRAILFSEAAELRMENARKKAKKLDEIVVEATEAHQVDSLVHRHEAKHPQLPPLRRGLKPFSTKCGGEQ